MGLEWNNPIEWIRTRTRDSFPSRCARPLVLARCNGRPLAFVRIDRKSTNLSWSLDRSHIGVSANDDVDESCHRPLGKKLAAFLGFAMGWLQEGWAVMHDPIHTVTWLIAPYDHRVVRRAVYRWMQPSLSPVLAFGWRRSLIWCNFNKYFDANLAGFTVRLDFMKSWVCHWCRFFSLGNSY
jgi:hypothetical protein